MILTVAKVGYQQGEIRGSDEVLLVGGKEELNFFFNILNYVF